MVKAQKPLHKTAMSFLTAISLSFSNLLTKKGRTIMTAVAGSIGIIGIAAILALANGVNNYINTTEEDTLSLYPLQIASSTVDLGTLLTGGSSSGSQDSVGNPATQTIGERSSLSQMFSSVSSNDLKALKSYLATNPDNVNSHLTTTEYQYDVNPLIYANSVTKGKRDVRQINPSTTFQSLGIGVSGTFAGSLQQSMVANTFSQLAADQGLYSAKYKVLDGHWPTAANQVVMVVTSKGETSDYMLYQMGLRDPDQLSSMVRKLAQGDKNIKVPKDKRTYSYQDLMNVSFKLVNPAATYRYNKSYQLWEDRSTDKSFMRKLLAKAETLHIVGIVEPTDASGTGALSPGMYYTPALTQQVITQAAASKIVKSQLAHPKVDVFTGKRFSKESSGSNKGFDMSKLFSINQAALAKAFAIDPSRFKLSAKDFKGMKIDQSKLPKQGTASPTINQQAMGQLMSDLVIGYISWCASNNKNPAQSSANFPLYMQTSAAQQVMAKDGVDIIDQSAVQKSMSSYMGQLTKALTGQMQTAMQGEMTKLAAAIPSAMSVNAGAMQQAFHFNLSAKDLKTLMTSMTAKSSASYDNNLKTLGYAKLDSPSEIDLYPKSFNDKDAVKQVLDDYNAAQKAAHQSKKVITYSDIVGTLMTSVTDIINMITAVLVAFVSISLVVSSIMIGIITYISVLERKKEIGILRAIGARKKDIRRVFNAETLIIGLLAGVIAILVVVLVSIPVNALVMAFKQVPNVMLLPPVAAVILIVISCLLTLVGGLIPASAAARRDPVEALRAE